MLGEFLASDPRLPVHPHVEILLRLPLDNCVMAVSFKLSGSLWTPWSKEPAHIKVDGIVRDLRALETVLTRPEMSALARVEVDVDSTDIAVLVRTSMPKLYMGGIISIYRE
jgi:hypothetical protein